ncbi:MAG: hypothetical protein OEZ34_09780 [Spirochaetia bacterium]|nr:hypothetical protein [Spirochaetia bacterium]
MEFLIIDNCIKKNKIQFIILKFLSILLFFLSTGCSDGHLRGYVSVSHDGKTWFVLDDDGGCDAVVLDGKIWKYKKGEKVRVLPGVHVISCLESEIEFEIPKGVVFHFNYWGP